MLLGGVPEPSTTKSNLCCVFFVGLEFIFLTPRCSRCPARPFAFTHKSRSQTSFRRLQMAYEKRFSNIASLKVQPTCDPLGSDPLFQALLRRVNNPEYWTGTEDGRRRRDSTGSQKQQVWVVEELLGVGSAADFRL